MKEEAILNLKKSYLAVNFIGLTLIVTVFVSAGVVELIKRFFAPFSGVAQLSKDTLNLLRYVLAFLALADFFLIKLIQRKYAAPASLNLPRAAVITFGLCEAVALYGLALFLLAGHPLDFYIFMAISLLYFYLFFPKYDKWEKLLAGNK
jgi:hypothetical protein